MTRAAVVLACGSFVLMACGCAAGSSESSISGHYAGLWEFELRDSVTVSHPCWLVDPQHCWAPEHRLYVTIRCIAVLELRAQGGVPQAIDGDLSLDSCAADYAGQPQDYVGDAPLPPPDLVTIASRTPLVGDAAWQPSDGVNVAYWRIFLALRNGRASIGELLGCVPESPSWERHFQAEVRVDTEPMVVLGTLADSHPLEIHCGAYDLFPTSSFALERT